MFATSILGYTLTTMWYIFILFLSVLIALWPAMIAKGKGHSFFLYFLISIPFWWITFFVVLFLKDRNVKPAAATPPSAE
ncbi:MAG: hypothetical protein QG628_980 [Patescibacteria group bacterium]|nr:hypothetical protein [Patescibacteria group bacterium]